jgi:hypothetical protein
MKPNLTEQDYLEMIKFTPNALRNVPKDLMSNREFILKAADVVNRDYPVFFKHIHYTYRADKELLLKLVVKDGKTLNHASDDLKNDKELALVAFKENHDSFFFFADELKKELKNRIEPEEVIQYLEACILKQALQKELFNNNDKITKKTKI